MSCLSWWTPCDLQVSVGSVGAFMFINKGC